MALQEQVTEDAMMISGMSLIGSDQAMMNASVASIIYSASIGAMESSNIVNADTIADEAFRAEIEAKKKEDDIAVDLAQATSTGISEENLRKIREGNVTYANGQFNIGGIMVDEEDMDTTVDSMVDNFDDVVAKHNLNAQESAVLMALLVDYQNESDPVAKAKILEDIGTKVSPEVRDDMAAEASKLGEHKAERMMTAEQTDVKMALQDSPAPVTEQSLSALVDEKSRASEIIEVKETVSFGGNAFFAGMEPVADQFNPNAQGEVKVAEMGATNDVTPIAPALTASL